MWGLKTDQGMFRAVGCKSTGGIDKRQAICFSFKVQGLGFMTSSAGRAGLKDGHETTLRNSTKLATLALLVIRQALRLAFVWASLFLA